jgi:two-component system chemotaxis sensor kinase CheA
MPPIDSEDQEILDGFLAETTELLVQLDEDLITLEKSTDDTELMNRIFRSIHTIKGVSSFLGFDLLVTVTHKTEDVLNRLRKGELLVNPEILDVILEATNLVKLLVSDIKAGAIQARETDQTINKLVPYLLENAGISRQTVPTEHLPGHNGASGESTLPDAPPVPKTPAAVESTEVQAHVVVPVTTPKAASEVATKKFSAPPKPVEAKGGDDLSDSTTVRVDVKRLDDLMNHVGELVLERNRMIQFNQDLQHTGVNQADLHEQFAKLTKRVSLVTSELQMQVLKMRMIPIEKIFKKFPRIVRSMTRDLGKEVDLQIIGEETELDRSVVDAISDPLIHLIRNALDHGLETPEVRLAAGKSRVGTLILSAAHEGNQIVVSIKDDGNGIDTDRVGQKAIEKGLITADQFAGMSREDAFELLFLPGFSTKDTTSDLSGRGVGMDVVKTNILKLSGLIEIKSTKGAGAEFILRLPLTLAIIQALLVNVAGEVYAIPLPSVLEIIRIDHQQHHQIGGQEVLKLRDCVLPLIRLQKAFNIQSRDEIEDFSYVVVVGAAEKRMGLIVTRLVGQQEVAIKSLGNYLSDIPGIVGTTILGDGHVALIIDPMALSKVCE